MTPDEFEAILARAATDWLGNQTKRVIHEDREMLLHEVVRLRVCVEELERQLAEKVAP